MARKGLPKSIIKKYGISKKAWAVFRGQKSSKSSNPRPKKARKVKKVARRRSYSRKRRRSSRKMTIPMGLVSGGLAMVGSANPSGKSIIQDAMEGNINMLLYDLRERFACIDMHGQFRPEWLIPHYGPLIVGALISKFVGGAPLNINRRLAAAKIPFIRI